MIFSVARLIAFEIFSLIPTAISFGSILFTVGELSQFCNQTQRLYA